MINFELVEKQLPQYLRYDAKKKLFQELRGFPDNIDSRLYTIRLKKYEPYLLQGDGIKEVLYVELPAIRQKDVDIMILSNSCDINPENPKFLPVNVTYAPIVNLEKYHTMLVDTGVEPKRAEGHVQDVKAQRISNLFYLPKAPSLDESVVFLDRVNSCDIQYFVKKGLDQCRLFTLSDYGFYLFLYKLSIHFTRIYERIERTAL
ncbi:MAG: hypothetical protein JRF30_11360 [Deltaproteobacteria bacterium]|nr:hypothetical protein [Deltaproteobacteria bacterium]